MRIALTLACALIATPAFADGVDGIAFAQAEEGTWWCRSDGATEGLRCALDKCNAEAGGQDCFETAWCMQARWSGLMTVFLSDFHTTYVLCGAPSQAALAETFRAWCAQIENADRCEFSVSINPNGIVRDDVGESFAGPAAQ